MVTVSFWAGNPRNDLMVNLIMYNAQAAMVKLIITDWEDIFNSGAQDKQ